MTSRMDMDEVVQVYARRLRERDEAHVRAELERLGVAEEDAPERVVLVYRSVTRIEAGGLPGPPEVLTREEFAGRFPGMAGVERLSDDDVERARALGLPLDDEGSG